MLKKYVDMGLNFLRRHSLWNFLSSCEKWIALAGLICLYGVAPLVLTALAIYMEDAFVLLYIPVGIFAGYIAEKMLDYVRPTIERAPTKIVNSGLLDILSVIIAFGAVGLFFGSFVMAIDAGSFIPFIAGQLGAVACVYFFYMLLSAKQSLNIDICEATSPAQSLLGIISLLVKAAYRMTPILFGMLIVLSTFMFMSVFFENNSWLMEVLFNEAIAGVMYGAFLPLIAYFGFLFYYFIVDFFVAFFRIADNSEKCSDKEPKSKK